MPLTMPRVCVSVSGQNEIKLQGFRVPAQAPVRIGRFGLMVEETLHHRGTTVVRRLILAPGEATRWQGGSFTGEWSATRFISS